MNYFDFIAEDVFVDTSSINCYYEENFVIFDVRRFIFIPLNKENYFDVVRNYI